MIGLTSEKNIAFVRGLGCYDQVIDYGSLDSLDATVKYVSVDFSGNYNTQYQLQTQLRENLVYNCLVGFVDWKNLKGKAPLPKAGEFFFAPTYAGKRQQEWGVAGFQQKVGIAWQIFMRAIHSHVSIQEHHGSQALQMLYQNMLQGNIDPKDGNLVSLIR